MKKFTLAICALLFMITVNFATVLAIEGVFNNNNDDISSEYKVTMKRDLLCLMMAYPEYVSKIEQKSDGKVYVVMKSGNSILYDDKRKKDYAEKLNSPDIQDMMEDIYPLRDIDTLMDENFDPGRVRIDKLLKEVYGANKSAIQSNLVNVRIGYKNCMFNKNNKAAESLSNVMKESIPLAQDSKEVYSCIFPTSGTFNYRKIAGTNRLSAHSFGIGIDLARDKRDYWKWASRVEGEKRLKSYPKELVRIFEKNNFVWGGKWGHFDILHFEYRPELIIKSKYFGEANNKRGLWYEGVNYNDEDIKTYINIIEKSLR